MLLPSVLVFLVWFVGLFLAVLSLFCLVLRACGFSVSCCFVWGFWLVCVICILVGCVLVRVFLCVGVVFMLCVVSGVLFAFVVVPSLPPPHLGPVVVVFRGVVNAFCVVCGFLVVSFSLGLVFVLLCGWGGICVGLGCFVVLVVLVLMCVCGLRFGLVVGYSFVLVVCLCWVVVL